MLTWPGTAFQSHLKKYIFFYIIFLFLNGFPILIFKKYISKKKNLKNNGHHFTGALSTAKTH
jgi:hypothetical protein